MLDEFCPDCGTHRVALFRYCLACGLDFDELDARGELPGGPYSRYGLDAPATSKAPEQAGAQRTVPHPSQGMPSSTGRRRRWGQYLPVGIAAVLAIAVVGVLAIGAGNGVVATSIAAGPTASPSVAAIGVPVVLTPPSTPAPTPVFAPTGATTVATVDRVVDGDTIIVTVDDTEYRVRYAGIDAPELVSLDAPVEYMGREAAAANRDLVSSASVILERDEPDTDDHGQLLRNVWVDRDGALVMVGMELVRHGLAKLDVDPTTVKYGAELADAEAAARATAVGMWAEVPLPVTGGTAAPAEPGPSALPRLVGADPIAVFSSRPTILKGGVGDYRWRSVGFVDPSATIGWDIRASATRACRFDWRFVPPAGAGLGGTIDVPGRDRAADGQTASIGFVDALLTVTTDCPDWTLSMQGAATP